MVTPEKLIEEEIATVFRTLCFALFELAQMLCAVTEEGLEFMLNYQTLWLKGENYIKSHDFQDKNKEEVLANLQKQAGQQKATHVPSHNQNLKSQDWEEGLDPETESESPHKTRNIKKTIRYIENCMIINDEIVKKSHNFSSLLHGLFSEDPEYSNEPRQKEKRIGVVKKNLLSEDSGFDTETYSEASSSYIKTIPTAVRSDVLRLTNTKTDVLNSLEDILNYIKTEVELQEVENYCKNSLIEHACHVVCKCSHLAAEYEETVHNFLVDLLQEIWSYSQSTQHSKWGPQLTAVKKLLSTPAICRGVLHYITDVLDNTTTILGKKNCNTYIEIVKVTLFLDVYSSTARKLKFLLKKDGKTQASRNVTRLWQVPEVHSLAHQQNLIEEIKSDIIPVVSKFLICVIDTDPIIASHVNEALEDLNSLTSGSA